MSTTHYNACFYLPVERRDGDKRPPGYWKEVGQAFANDKGQIAIKLHALPLPSWDGKLRLFPATATSVAAKRPATSADNSEGWGDDFWVEK